MAFVIAYRHPQRPNIRGACIVGSQLQVKEAIERLRREGCEVTRITPPPISLILLGQAPRLW
jgi:hypothetical protein